MEQQSHGHPDFGSGQKKLSIYLLGIVICVVLTLIAFWSVMSSDLPRSQIMVIIFSAAALQFLVQVFCFLRINVATEQSRTNVLSLLFTIVVLTTIMVGSLWIMANLNYFMMH